VKKKVKGLVGADLTVEQGYHAAQLSTLNALQAIHSLVGIDNVVRIFKVLGMVNVAPGFNNTTGVVHGCSELLLEVFGEQANMLVVQWVWSSRLTTPPKSN
jgi:hypothetical protein